MGRCAKNPPCDLFSEAHLVVAHPNAARPPQPAVQLPPQPAPAPYIAPAVYYDSDNDDDEYYAEQNRIRALAVERNRIRAIEAEQFRQQVRHEDEAARLRQARNDALRSRLNSLNFVRTCHRPCQSLFIPSRLN